MLFSLRWRIIYILKSPLILISPKSSHLIDATKSANGQIVMLKKISILDHPKEIDITRYFSREPFASHPKNHCIQLIDVLQVPSQPDIAILVLPLLRPYEDPWFESVGEAVEFFRQIFEV